MSISTLFRLLTFQLNRDEMLAFDRRHFLLGLVGTWVVGMGRYWDNDRASLLQHLGVGSVVYIFVLAGFIWLLVLPYRVSEWTYFRVLTFVALTSFPAIFYAIPVEQFTNMQTANRLNVWFLAAVAAWRLCLLYYFLNTFTQLRRTYVIAITMLPICLIITALTILNLEQAVFDIMGGVRNSTPNDGAYAVLFTLTLLSSILVLPLLAIYGWGINSVRKESIN